jgi:hypothetical protein
VALDVFHSARAGLETVRGTGVTPTRLIYFETGTFEEDVATIKPDEHRASYNPNFSAAAGPVRNAINMTGRVSFDDLIWWANLYFKAVAAGVGGAADKTWTFLPDSTTDTVKTATIQMGFADTIATTPAIEQQYVMGETLTLHFEKNDDGAVTFDARMLGGEAPTQITAFTGSLSDRTTIPASAVGTTIYADQASAIGTTVDTGFVSLDFRLNLGPVLFYTLNGSNGPSGVYRPTWRRWEATLIRQFTSDLYWDDYQDKTVQKIRARTLGPSLGGSNYKIDLDLYGVVTSRRLEDVDGIITENLTLGQIYDTTATADHLLTVVNATAAIT